MRHASLTLAALATTLLALPASAHHSHGNYRMTEYTQLTGIVTELHWVNPHAWVYLDVTDADGQTASWLLEAASAGTLNRQGIAEDLVQPGDTVSVRCHRLRDGSNGCLLGFLTPAGGVEREWD